MRNTIRLLLLLLFPLAGVRVQAQLSIPYDHEHIYSEGRIGLNPDLGAREIWWPGSMVSLKFQGDAISATLEDERGDNFFNIIVDGEPSGVLHLDSGKHEYLLASGLDQDVHTVELHKRNDWSFGWSRFYGFELNGTLTYAPEKKAQLIEFYGNSITTGYGNEDYTGEDRATGEVTNNYLAYGALTARNLGMEYSCISHSGIGIMVSWHSLIMPEEYYRQVPSDADSRWDFQGNQADYVVVNLFQNDSWLVEKPDHPQFIRRFGDTAPTGEEIRAAYVDFLNQVRTAHPKANIICMLGNMDITRPGSIWPVYVHQAAEQAGGKIHTLFVPYKDTPGHPKVEEQQILADRLTGLILDIGDTIGTVNIEVSNKTTGDPVPEAAVQLGDTLLYTDSEGRLSLTTMKEEYPVHISCERYRDTAFSLSLSSDTLLQVPLRQLIANAEFVVNRSGSPLPGATVKLGENSTLTSTGGIATFYDLPTYTPLVYEIVKDSTLAGDTLVLVADTTLRFHIYGVGTDPAPDARILIYPNPAGDYLHVEGLAGFDYQIVDIRGRRVTSGHAGTFIDISGLASGPYILYTGRKRALKFTVQ